MALPLWRVEIGERRKMGRRGGWRIGGRRERGNSRRAKTIKRASPLAIYVTSIYAPPQRAIVRSRRGAVNIISRPRGARA